MFRLLVNSDRVKEFILVGYGAGNIDRMYYDSIKRAISLGKPVVIVSECLKGGAEQFYEVGAEPIQMGAVSGLDMTEAAALQKLMYALGKVKDMQAHQKAVYTPDELRREVQIIMHTPYAREFDDYYLHGPN